MISPFGFYCTVGCMGACERGPNIRVSTSAGIFEINSINGISKVVSVFRDAIGVDVDEQALGCLRENLAGNLHLQRNELSLAIESYDRALSLGYAPQEGVLLSLRSEAYLARAFSHRLALQQLKESDGPNAKYASGSMSGHEDATNNGSQSRLDVSPLAAVRRSDYGNGATAIYKRACFHQALYHRALLRSLADSVRAAALLPKLYNNPARAAMVFVCLSKFDEASECFMVAAEAASNEEVKSQFLEKAAAAAAAAVN
mmetsp:Transcript_68847/g.118176  ORF Transcript_68847/g.118176 Transcript_68847/m.118176 type:complete len:258 (+) Transcript_68847:285-1058(+)